MKLVKHPTVYSCRLENAERINRALLDGFIRHRELDSTGRSHYFEGRYENIYIADEEVPELVEIKKAVRQLVAEISSIDADKLKAGLWFNAMEPGHRTLPHRHDDDDEIMSAVYYVETPMDSGKLVLTAGDFVTSVTPEAGLFVLFPPNMMHEVTTNNSNDMRLSLGINVGPLHTDN
jgi:hypothetical protein